MKSSKVSVLLLIAVIFWQVSKAQESPLLPGPVVIAAIGKDSLKFYEPQIIKAAKWLEATSLSKEKTKRNEIIQSVVAWAGKSPNILFKVRASIFKLFNKNIELMGVYMASYSRWSLENNYSRDELLSTVTGIKGVIKCYRLGGAMMDKAMDKVAKLETEGKLLEYVKKQITE